MTVFLIADVKITNDSWVPAYAADVHEIVRKHGGQYLARSANITTIEGEKPDTSVIALISFPSKTAFQEFLSDPDYAPHSAARKAGSISRINLIDDTDVAGTIPYLPKS